MTKRDITMDEIVEGFCKAYASAWAECLDARGVYDWPDLSKWSQEARDDLESAMGDAFNHLLTTANITPEQLIALARGDACVVPVEPTEATLEAYFVQTGESNVMRQRVYDRARFFYRVMHEGQK